MSENKNFDAFNDEVDAILAEARAMRESEKISENAKKFKNRAPMEEIFSNTTREVRRTNQTPQEAEEKFKKLKESKNRTTIDAQKVFEQIDEDEKIKEIARLKEQREKEENEPKKVTVVSLKPEYGEGTVVSQDIIEDAQQLNIKPVEFKDVEDIDVEISEKGETAPQPTDESDNDANIESKKIKKKKSRFEQLFGKPKLDPETVNRVESKVPAYIANDDKKTINIKAGKFTEVVKTEYEEYLKSPDPSISKSYKPFSVIEKSEPKQISEKNQEKTHKQNKPHKNQATDINQEREKRNRAKNFEPQKKEVKEVPLIDKEDDISEKSFSQKFMELFTPNANDKSVEETVVTVDDYQSAEDEKSVMEEINGNIKKLFFQSVITAVITVFSLVVMIIQNAFPNVLSSAIPYAEYMVAVFNLLTVLLACFFNRVTIVNGITPLFRFKGNCDTALSVAAIAVTFQCSVSFINAKDFFDGKQNYYAFILLLGFLLNCVGKLIMVLRVKNNFRFIIAKTPAYAGKIYTNETDAAKMMSGTLSHKPFIAYQHRTDFLSNFLKISYAPDPSEEMAGKIAPITIICSLLVAIVYAIIHKTFTGSVTTLSVMMIISVPLSTLLAVNIPMFRLCKRSLKNNAMIAGYLSVKQFCDTKAIMVDSFEIYPKGSIVLEGIKPFVQTNIDNTILAVSEMMKEANCPQGMIFDEFREENLYKLPKVESVMYEEKLGLVGWVDGERILVGKKELLAKYGVRIPQDTNEDYYTSKNKQVTYIARSGELLAMLITVYKASLKVATEFQQAESNGMSILIRTTDCNITSDLIADSFGVFYRTVKVLSTGLGNVCKEVSERKEESSRAYLATRGRFVSLCNAVNGCVKMKSNISLAVIIQAVAVIFGIIVVATMALYASVEPLGTVEILLYSIFWIVASIAAPLIQKP